MREWKSRSHGVCSDFIWKCSWSHEGPSCARSRREWQWKFFPKIDFVIRRRLEATACRMETLAQPKKKRSPEPLQSIQNPWGICCALTLSNSNLNVLAAEKNKNNKNRPENPVIVRMWLSGHCWNMRRVRHEFALVDWIGSDFKQFLVEIAHGSESIRFYRKS